MSPLALIVLLGGCVDYGVGAQTIQDLWTQPDRAGGVDVLWVVDDSQSMTEEQGLLAEHAEAFTSLLIQVPIDLRIGVVRTDPGDEGLLVGEPLTPDTPALDDAFAEQVSLAPIGDRDEQGFTAALLGADPEGINAEVMRAAADLEIVVFSDEDDHSDLDARALLDALAAPRNGGEVRLSAIVGDLPDGCVAIEAAADPGPHYVEAAELSGGLRESICDADYDALLERLAFHVLGMQRVFPLSAIPTPGTIDVRVDGGHLHRRDAHGWRYDPGPNAVVTDGYAVPPPGSSVVIEYREWSGGDFLDTGGGA